MKTMVQGTLIDLLFKPTTVPATPPQDDISDAENARIANSSLRRCHDCGKPTTQYRCPACKRKFQRKYDVEPEFIADDDYDDA